MVERKDSEDPQRDLSVVATMIDETELSLYETAGLKTGYRVDIAARPGEKARFSEQKIVKIGSPETVEPLEHREVDVPEGRLQIHIRKGPQQPDHSSFWKVFYELKSTSA